MAQPKTPTSINETVSFAHQKVAYIVAQPESPLEQHIVKYLANYLTQVTGVPASIVGTLWAVPDSTAAIVVSNGKVKWPFDGTISSYSDEAYRLKTGTVAGRRIAAVIGASQKGVKRGVQRLIILSRQEPSALIIPPLNLTEQPWIAQREWTLCAWEPSRVRGVFRNNNVDGRLNIYAFDKDKLARYVAMYDWFGYSGCQLMETCATYAAFGSKEAAQEWLGEVIDMARANGQEVSLWVWAAQFSGYDWFEPNSFYQTATDQRAFNDPAIRAIFERYYDGYVRHAAKIDRLIGHFYDPGQLTDRRDVFDFMRLLESKAKAKNPNIQMGIDLWAAGDDYFQLLVDNGFQDYLMLPVAFPPNYKGDQMEQLYKTGKKLGLRMGCWGWYQTEMETDQMPSMHVNAKLLKDLYNRFRQGAFAVHTPQYYSEMEAHHLNNIYSMYAAAQLLWDPDRNPDQILEEITDAIWGPKNGPRVLQALQLIQDVRTGPTWETYWWTSPGYRLGTEDPQSDLERAQQCIDDLGSMTIDSTFVPKLPLAVSSQELVELMMPHLKQIRHYSRFRIEVENFKKAAKTGASPDQLQEMLQKAWQPVPEYTTWIGTFGTPELRMQRQIILGLEKEYKIRVNDPPYLIYKEADRVLQQIQNLQRQNKHMVEVNAEVATCQFYWPQQVADERLGWLVKQGLLVPTSNGNYRLADWENWAQQ